LFKYYRLVYNLQTPEVINL